MAGLSVTGDCDQYLLRTNVSVLSAVPSVLYSAGYGYDAGSRLLKVVSESANATYSYLENSALVGQISFTNPDSESGRMVTTRRLFIDAP